MSCRRHSGLVFVMILTGFSLTAGRLRTSQGEVQKERQTKQRAESPPVRELESAGTADFGVPGPVAVFAGTQCDADGNVYFESTPSLEFIEQNARSGNRPPLTKLSMESKSATRFQYPPLGDYSSHFDQGFYVTPRGDVFALVQACPYKDGCKPPHFPVNLIVKYNHDASVDSIIKLTPPSDLPFLAFKFAVFLDGNVLVTGLEGAAEEDEAGRSHYRPSKPFTGIFDRDGAYVGPLSLPNDITPPPNAAAETAPKKGSPAGATGATGPEQSVATAKPGTFWAQGVIGSVLMGGLDGNVYLLRASYPPLLYSISPDGRVLDERTMTLSQPGMWPTLGSFTQDGRLFVEFSQAPTAPRNERLHPIFAVIDPQTGSILETYDVPSTAGIPACMDPQNELLFLRSDKTGQLEVAKFVAH